MTELSPCRFCEADCSVQTFRGEHIQGVMKMWVCANNEQLGGACPSKDAYLSADFWNEAMSQASPLSSADEPSDNKLAELQEELGDAIIDLRALTAQQKMAMESGTGFSADAIAALCQTAATALTTLQARLDAMMKRERAKECATHDWDYAGTDYHGSHKGEDVYRCRNCGKYEYRP